MRELDKLQREYLDVSAVLVGNAIKCNTAFLVAQAFIHTEDFDGLRQWEADNEDRLNALAAESAQAGERLAELNTELEALEPV